MQQDRTFASTSNSPSSQIGLSVKLLLPMLFACLCWVSSVQAQPGCSGPPAIDCSGINPNRNNDPGLCSYTAQGSEFDPITSCDLVNDFNNSSTLDGATFPVGTTMVIWTATNTSGATTTCSVDIVITDNEDPVLVCQDVTLELDANGEAYLYVFAEALVSETDNCGVAGGVGVTGPGTYTCAFLGENTVTIYQDDAAGNQTSCTFTATITDPLGMCCVLSDLTVSNISGCNDQGTSNPNDDTFTADVTVAYNTNTPGTGTLDLAGDGMASVAVGSLNSSTSHTFTGVEMSADGGPINLTATFSDLSYCSLQNTNAGSAPASCSPPPANDLCENATPISCGQTVAGSTFGATLDNVGTCGTSITAPGVWYSFTGLNGSTTVSTCGQAGYDTKISVFSGTCGALVCEGGNDDACGLQSRVDFNTTAGTDYYVLVHGFGSAVGNFGLTLTCPPACTITAIGVNNISECSEPGTANLSDDTFTADVTVTFANPPATGTLGLTGDGTASVGADMLDSPTSHTFSGVTMAADGGAISLTAAFSDDITCTLQNTNAGTAPAACSIICIDTAIDNLIGYVEGLGISSGTKRAITRRLDKAAYRLCNGYPVSYVISTLNSVIDYVEYQSGGAIPTASADYIIAQLQDMIGVLDAGAGLCCSNPNFSHRPGTFGPADAHGLEILPNPFTRQATLRFNLPQAGQATLNIFSSQGRLVRQLHNGYLEVGSHQLQWDGTDARGSQLPSGLYLIQLRLGEELITKKALLLQGF